jgi:hypothetical protein
VLIFGEQAVRRNMTIIELEIQLGTIDLSNINMQSDETQPSTSGAELPRDSEVYAIALALPRNLDPMSPIFANPTGRAIPE